MEVSAEVSCDFQYLPIDVSNFMDRNLPCDLGSLTHLRKVLLIFIVNQHFHVIRVEWQLPSLLHARPRTRRPGLVVFNLGLTSRT